MKAKLRLLGPPEAALDGSGLITHTIQALNSDGDIIPGQQETVMIGQADIDQVMAMPDGTAAARAAKNTAYKNLIASALPPGWLDEELRAIDLINTATAASAEDIDQYITGTLGQSWAAGVDFTL